MRINIKKITARTAQEKHSKKDLNKIYNKVLHGHVSYTHDPIAFISYSHTGILILAR